MILNPTCNRTAFLLVACGFAFLTSGTAQSSRKSQDATLAAETTRLLLAKWPGLRPLQTTNKVDSRGLKKWLNKDFATDRFAKAMNITQAVFEGSDEKGLLTIGFIVMDFSKCADVNAALKIVNARTAHVFKLPVLTTFRFVARAKAAAFLISESLLRDDVSAFFDPHTDIGFAPAPCHGP